MKKIKENLLKIKKKLIKITKLKAGNIIKNHIG